MILLYSKGLEGHIGKINCCNISFLEEIDDCSCMLHKGTENTSIASRKMIWNDKFNI